jgi:TRAP-type C4-dicarboxylate transport system permease small subunit
MKSLLLSVDDTLYRCCIWIAGLSILSMSLIIPWGIFARYVLGTGSSWPEPVAILLMVVFTFIGAAASYRAGAHMAVTMITDRLPPLQRRLGSVLVQVLMVLVCVFMTWYGTQLCITTWNQSLASLPGVRVGMTYAPIPLGGLLTLVFVLERLLLGDQSERKVMRFDQLEEREGAA